MKFIRVCLGLSIVVLIVLSVKFPWVFRFTWNFLHKHFWKLYNLIVDNFVNKYHNTVTVRNNQNSQFRDDFSDF